MVSGFKLYTAISRKVVGKSARDNPERYYGWLRVHCSSKKFERAARQAMDVCLWLLKESNKSRFDSHSVRNGVLIISHITFRDCRMHSFSDKLSRNSCIILGERILLTTKYLAEISDDDKEFWNCINIGIQGLKFYKRVLECFSCRWEIKIRINKQTQTHG